VQAISLMMEAANITETLVNFQQSTRLYGQEYSQSAFTDDTNIPIINVIYCKRTSMAL
jgi:hypothetical protein